MDYLLVFCAGAILSLCLYVTFKRDDSPHWKERAQTARGDIFRLTEEKADLQSKLDDAEALLREEGDIVLEQRRQIAKLKEKISQSTFTPGLAFE